MGLHFNVLPVRGVPQLRRTAPRSRLVDSSSIVRHARRIKTPFEAETMRQAGQISRRVFEEAKGFIREGRTEIEIGAMLDTAAERPARIRFLNYKAHTWKVLSGP